VRTRAEAPEAEFLGVACDLSRSLTDEAGPKQRCEFGIIACLAKWKVKRASAIVEVAKLPSRVHFVKTG